MVISEQLEKIPNPRVYNRKGTDCFYDSYRENMVPATPEEEVRQKLLVWLEKECHVPTKMILVEQHLSHYGINSNDRADIVIHESGENGLMTAVAVIECKAPAVVLSDAVCEQCFRYTDDLGIDYAIVTNGVELFAFKYHATNNQYRLLEGMPSYEQLLSGMVKVADGPTRPPRPSFDELMNPEVQELYLGDIIGMDTPVNLKAHCINLFECLVDTDKTLIKQSGKKFTIVEDRGIITPTYGNAAGGQFAVPCRAFLIQDRQRNNILVSLGISAYVTEKSPLEKTALCVGIRDKKKSHHSLQLVIDTYVQRTKTKYLYTSTGRITIGKKGSGSAKELVKKVATELPHLYCNGKIILGSVDANKLLMLDAPDMTELVLNLIDYALLRDEYRAEVTKAGKP